MRVQTFLARVDVDANDAARSALFGALEHGQTDAAETKDGNLVGHTAATGASDAPVRPAAPVCIAAPISSCRSSNATGDGRMLTARTVELASTLAVLIAAP